MTPKMRKEVRYKTPGPCPECGVEIKEGWEHVHYFMDDETPKLSEDHRDNRMAELQADYNDLEGRLVRLETWMKEIHDAYVELAHPEGRIVALEATNKTIKTAINGLGTRAARLENLWNTFLCAEDCDAIGEKPLEEKP